MLTKWYGKQGLLWCMLFNAWLVWGICFMLVHPVYAAWKSGYGYRKQFTIQGDNLASNVTQFPLLVDISDGDIDDHCDDDGTGSWDIMFTQSDGTTDLDIDWIDYSESGGNALITCYVSQASWEISSDGSTTGYLYYGNASAGDPNTANGVWDSNYIAVWHMDEASGTIYDSADATTSHDSTVNTITAYQQTGKIHWCVDMDGTDDEINFADHAEFTVTDVTVEGWVYIDTWQDNEDFFSWFDDTSDDGFRWFGVDAASPGEMRVYGEVADNLTITNSDTDDLVTATWTHYAMVRDSGTFYMYTNGAVGSDSDSNAGEIDSSDVITIGSGYDNIDWADAKFEEWRYSNAVRSADWLAFQYANVNEADGELTWGDEESGFTPKVIIIGYVGQGISGFFLVLFRRRKKK